MNGTWSAAPDVARLTASRWSGRRGSDGISVVRLRGAAAETRVALRRVRGRFRVLPRFESSPGCGLVRRAKLERPFCGGRTRR